MKVIFEFPDNTKAVMISYITERDGSMYMSLKNVTTAELSGGGPIKVPSEDQDPEE